MASFDPKNISLYRDTSSITEAVKIYLGILKPNGEMTNDEVRKVCRYFGMHASDFKVIDGEPVFGREAMDAMLFIALTEFPKFYEKYKLIQIN